MMTRLEVEKEEVVSVVIPKSKVKKIEVRYD